MFLLLSLLAWAGLLFYGINYPIKGVPKNICGGCFGDDEERTEQTQTSTINYTPEAQEAQKTWWQTLQDWATSGDWGATDMNWEDIFKSAERKINQYYWGGVNSPGLAGKMKASAARRNVSQSPALENMLTSLGFQQSQDLSDLITNLTTQKAGYTESARKNWLASLMNLAGFKSGVTTTGTTTVTSPDDTLSQLLGIGVSSALKGLTSGLSNNWLDKLFSSSGGGAPSSLYDKLFGSVSFGGSNYSFK